MAVIERDEKDKLNNLLHQKFKHIMIEKYASHNNGIRKDDISENVEELLRGMDSGWETYSRLSFENESE